MLEKKFYSNGQPVFDLTDNKPACYYENGKIKAQGSFMNDQMEGEWVFYRETGQLWQVANFKNNKKHGSLIRYDRKSFHEPDCSCNRLIISLSL